MSGIFGLYYRNQQMVDRETLNNMGASMLHRGPDGIEVWSERNIGIGNCMFHTTPESVGETLPYVDKDSGLVITADARIDAREELAKSLGLFERLKNGIPDSHLILAAYRKWQTKCVHHLVGDFAFLIWDKNRQHLFCARDHLGVKPLYYHLSDQVFAVGSEVRAILKIPEVPKQINEARIADFLVEQLEGIDKTSTFYKSISRLPPAHTLLVSKEKIVIEKYWDLDAETEIRYQSDNEYVEAFHEIFKESVKDRLRCNGKATSMLSGGNDSSYIVGTARQLMQDAGSAPLPVYSGVSERDQDCRETYFINSVITQGGIESIKVRPGDVSNFEQELLVTDGSLEELFDISMTIPMVFYLMARDRGQRVMLDGVEGDLVHSLSTSYPASLFRCGHYARAISESFDIWRNTYGKQVSLNYTFKATIRAALIPDYLRRWKRKLPAKSIQANILKGNIINRDFAREVDIESRLGILASHSTLGSHASLREKQVHNIMHPYLVTALERYDRIASICTVEPRHPLLDKRLVEFSVSLPWEQKVRHGWSKYIIRRAGESFLPQEVVWRRGWDDIGWLFTSALIQKRASWMIDQIRERRELLGRYVAPEVLKTLAKNNKIVALSTYEESTLSLFRLSNCLQLSKRNGVSNYAH